jgi:arsenical pump membrane protein
VLAGEPTSGATFAIRILPAALSAAGVTAALLVGLQWWRARGEGDRPLAREAEGSPAAVVEGSVPGRVGRLGALACGLAAVLVLALPHPGIPVLAVGLLATAVRIGERRLSAGAAVEAVGPLALATLFALSVLLGLLARTWSGPTDLLGSVSPWETCAIGALAAIGVNNLPAAVLLSATPPPHPRALLLGLNLGPNLAVSGSLSAYLWFKAARGAGADPSALRFTRIGAPMAIVAMLAGLATIALVGPS